MKIPIRVLLVDDSPFFLEVASEFLQLHEAFQVVGTASNGHGALEQALKLQPDVILLDFNLAEESAIQLIPVIKEQLPATRIVVVTIMVEEGYRESVLQSGADAFVRKPVMTQTLVPTIADLYETSKRSPNSKN